jgi:hypothetical protein
MKDIDDMRIGESFYLKRTVAVISTRTGKPCEFDEERIDINDLIITELEKIKAEMEIIHNRYAINFQGFSMSVAQECIDIINNEIAELKGENK